MGKQQEKTILAKQKLVNAATKLFNERGIEQVGIREICAEAGVTTGTFYHHYNSKQDIFSAIYDNHEEQFEAVFGRLCEKPPYKNGILQFFTETLSELVEEDGVDFTMHRMFVMKRHSTGRHSLYKGMNNLIKLAIENGELSDEHEVDTIMNYLFTVFRGTVYEWCILPDDSRTPLKEMIEESIGFAIRAFEF